MRSDFGVTSKKWEKGSSAQCTSTSLMPVLLLNPSGKVLTSWRLNLDKDGEVSVIRGIDILEFEADKLKKKMAYMKADKPHLENN